MKSFSVFACLVSLVLVESTASAIAYRVEKEADGSYGARFDLPYTLGTHEGKVKVMVAELQLEPLDWAKSRGSFVVPISALENGDAKLECHLQEALGLDYAKSDFPEDHVCDDDKLPTTGKNAIVFPEIKFEWLSAKEIGEKRLAVKGRWTIHGVTKESTVELSVVERSDGPGWRLQGKHPLALKDFGIEVKPFLFVKVKDVASVSFDLKLVPKT